MAGKEAIKTPSKHSQMPGAKNSIVRCNFFNCFQSWMIASKKLANEVPSLKLSNEALSMQITDLSTSNIETEVTLMDMQDKVDLLQN